MASPKEGQKQYSSSHEFKEEIAKKVGITEDQVTNVLRLAWPTLLDYGIKHDHIVKTVQEQIAEYVHGMSV